jgi:prepilin-type N-terminal cleavage/methylation domain-containing protein
MFRLNRTSGFTVPELIVTVVVVSILGLITAQVIIDVSRSSQQRQLTSTRDQVAIWMRSSAGSPGNLVASLKKPENSLFYKCVCGGGCTSAVANDFVLYDASANPPKPLSLSYNAMGTVCENPNAANCYISVKIKFIAQCAPTLPSSTPYPPYTCSTPAEFFGITFQVIQNPLSVIQGNQFKDIGGTVFFKVSDLKNPDGSEACP